VRSEQDGFTYLGILFALAISAVAASATLVLLSVEEKRERERALLFVGNQYRAAVASYYESSRDEPRQYPRHLNELLEDRRTTPPQRHLRQAYGDPVSRQEFSLIRMPDGGIVGVRSLSTAPPLQRNNFDVDNEDFKGRARYMDWRFVYVGKRRRDQPAVMLPMP